MAVLSTQDRADLVGDIIKSLSLTRETVNAVKDDIRAAVDAADDWANTNAAAYNSALPQPFRGAATADQKSRILEAVIVKRRTRGA